MMTVDLSRYSAILFDCDGVILDSNRVKTDAFWRAAVEYGESAANDLVQYHVQNGGVSRYTKFEYFLTHIVGEGCSEDAYQNLLDSFARNVVDGLMSCPVTGALPRLKQATAGAQWVVVSGGDQQELREVFSARGIEDYFEGGIHGAPRTKDEILIDLSGNYSPGGSAVFLGDSVYDFEVARRHDLDFVFISGWSEVADWEEFVARNCLPSVESLEGLIR